MTDETAPDEHPEPERWWRHRRRQSYGALAGVFALGAASVSGLIPEGAVPVVQSAIWALTSVVIFYHGGASAVDAVAKLRGMQ